MSILRIFIIACIARWARPGRDCHRLEQPRGVICQEKPQRSLHQPHMLSAPPLAAIAFQSGRSLPGPR